MNYDIKYKKNQIIDKKMYILKIGNKNRKLNNLGF